MSRKKGKGSKSAGARERGSRPAAGDQRRVQPQASREGPQPRPLESLSTASDFRLLLWLFAAAAFAVLWWAYWPALHGPFLFDDTALPFALRSSSAPLTAWLRGARPALMFTYWVNFSISGTDPFSYHVCNVLFHAFTAGLVFLIVRRLGEWSGVVASHRDLLAAFAASVFLLHPVQTEAVAYITGRSESLSVMLAYAGLAVFLYRSDAEISWRASAVVLVCFGLGLLSKEHTIALPALLVLTDWWWAPGGRWKAIRGNWRLYLPMAAGGLAGLAFYRNLIFHSTTAGFGLKDLPWYQYLFTQFRALFVYPRLFLLPAGLNADWDFPYSRTILDHGSIFGLAMLVALIAVAWRFRRQFPLASYGFFAFLLLMAPTSSILPIKDPLAERRLYISMLGLLLIVVEFLGRVKIDRRVLAYSCAAVVLAAAVATHARAAVWSDPVALWKDTVRKSPQKWRTHYNLGVTYMNAQRYEAAIAEFEKAAQLEKPSYSLLVDWGLVYDLMNRPEDALAKLRQAAALEPTGQIYYQIGMVYAKRRRLPEALQALDMAEKADPLWAPTYNYRAKIYFSQANLPGAMENYRRALELDPTLADARDELALVTSLLGK